MTYKPFHPLLLAGALLLSSSAQAQSLLPKPQQMTPGKGVFRLDKGVKIVNEAGKDAENIYSEEWKKLTGNKTLPIIRCTKLPGASSPEAYRLHVTPDTLLVSAATAEGFLRAWQTIRQLQGKKGVACCDIVDEPAYKWRGLMLDVSRHFFPISHLKKQIDVMAQYKFNRLHIHLTDAAGWRMEIKRYPRLTSLAAWRPQRTWKEWNAGGNRYCTADSTGASGGFYTQDELRDLVAYAAQRGITVVPEIEMPGHSEEVLTAYPELSCTHEPYKQADFCPGSVATYDFLENVLKEVMDVFPSRYIHVGGDEAAKKSWPSCPLCQEKMRELGIDKVDGLQAHLIAHMGKFLSRHGRQLVGWDEVIAGNLSENTTVMVWRGTEKAHEAIEHGYDVVLSPGAYCYFDSYQDAPKTQPEAIGGFLTTERVYSYVPGSDLPEGERKKITGVQGNLWAEYIPTAEHAEYMLYPRALALAEIGWNGTEKKDYSEFRQRLLSQVDQLRAQGVNAFDLRKEVGERKETRQLIGHKARGAKVTYNHAYNSTYNGGGDQALVDGKSGGWAHGDGRWQGFIGRDCFDITVDLGKKTKLSSVGTDFMQSCGPEIFYPSQYSVAVSDDGKDFKTVFDQKYESKKDSKIDVKMFTWKGSASARYIRIKAKPSTFGGWLFVDEVIVK